MRLIKPSLILLSALMPFLGGRIALGQEKNPPFSLDDPRSKRAVVAVVGPWKITAEEFRLSYEFGPAFAKRAKDAKRLYLDYMIDEKLLALDASSRGDAIASFVAPGLAEIEGDLATEELYKDDVQSKVRVSGTEIGQGIEQSKRHLKLQWIFAPTKERVQQLAEELRSGAPYDSLYRLQGSDSALSAYRAVGGTLFQIRMDNPAVGAVADTLRLLRPSAPLKGADGWYIIRIVDETKDVLTTQSDDIKLREDVSRALLQHKSDSLSKQYVSTLITSNRPVTVPETVSLLSCYLALKFLDSSDVREWGLSTPAGDQKGPVTLQDLDEHGRMPLVKLSRNVRLPLSEFLAWYRDREYLIRIQKTSKEAYLHSLEQLLWQWVRDHLLVERAYKRNLQARETVRIQKKWWEEKLLFEAEKRLIADSISFHDNALQAYYEGNRRHYKDAKGSELTFSDARDAVLRDYYEDEVTKRILHRLNALKTKYAVSVDEQVLARIPVEADPKAIDLYAVKKGGTFPRPAFPVIDMLWQGWK